jgi:hypothetical protein
VVTGKLFGRSLERNRSPDFTEALDERLATCRGAKKAHCVMDNGSTHGSKRAEEWLESKGGAWSFVSRLRTPRG